MSPPSHEQLDTPSTDPGHAAGKTRAIRLTVNLPIFAEREVITELLEGLHQLIPNSLHEIILLVAAKAPAETRRICEENAARFPICRISEQQDNPGLGMGVRQGIAEATGTHILLMDSDGEMDVHTVPLMLAKIEETGADMVVGSRWAKGGGVEGYDPFKYVLNRGYQLLFRLLFRTSVHDLTLGFKLARTDVMQSLPWNSRFHDIGCETTMRVIRAGYHVTDVPTVWRKRKEGESSNPFLRNFKYVRKALSILFGPSHRKALP